MKFSNLEIRIKNYIKDKELFNYKTLLLFLSLCVIVLSQTYFDVDGRTSPDSTYYLRLAKNLVAGEGYYIPDYTVKGGQSFFAIWPVGYPVMIYLVSKFTGLGVLWASKILNLIIIGTILLLFQRIFKKNSHWAGLMLFVDSFILIFTFTWSEVPFILFLLFISISLYKSVETKGNIFWLAGLFFSGIALFLIRYIGLFSVGLIGLIALIHIFKREWIFSIKLMAIGLLQTTFAGLYLYHNKILTGYMTGMPRNLPKESNLELFNQLMEALRDEYILIKCGIPIILSTVLFLLLGIYLFMARKKNQPVQRSNALWKYFLLAGIFYFGAIVGAKWFSDFMPLDFRYLFPSSFMLILALATYLQCKPGIRILNSTVLYMATWIVLTIHYIPQTNYILTYFKTGVNKFETKSNFIKNTREISETYQEIEPRSIVIFGSDHLRYMKENIIPIDIYNKNSFQDMMDYSTRNGEWNVYVRIRKDLDPDIYHESFIRFMEDNKDKKIVKVFDISLSMSQ